jgi:hypothetical protein
MDAAVTRTVRMGNVEPALLFVIFTLIAMRFGYWAQRPPPPKRQPTRFNAGAVQ